MGPVTTNPILIALINMTVVFAVLYGLSLMIRLITLIDPTKKKQIAPIESAAPLTTEPSVTDSAIQQEEYDELVILFTAAIAAYGQSGAKIVALRLVSGGTWSQSARIEGVSVRNGMF